MITIRFDWVSVRLVVLSNINWIEISKVVSDSVKESINIPDGNNSFWLSVRRFGSIK